MALVGSIFAMLGRFAGRLLNSALGWAALLLFGKVESGKQTLLLVIALGSLLWVLTVLGFILPNVGTFMLAFVPVPDFVDEGIIRLTMLALAALIPILVGIAAMFVAEPTARPKGAGIVTAILRGYPFTLVLALTIVMLAVVSLVRKVRSVSKRWEDAHVPVLVKPGGYDRVLNDLRRVLNEAGLTVEPKPAPTVLSVPPRLLAAVAGKALGGLVPNRLMLLTGGQLEILVYPSDVAISGTREATARSRAAIAAQLTHSPAYMTTSAESERIEDEITEIAEIADTEGSPSEDVDALRRRLRDLDARIARLTIPFDEWETVYRGRLQVERNLLAKRLSEDRPIQPTAPQRTPSAIDQAIGVAGLALIAVDVVLLIAERVWPSRRRA